MAVDPFVDTHCHLDMEPLASSVEVVLERARAAGVRRCVSIGTSVEASQANVALAKRYPEMVASAVGVHPNDADGVTDADLADIDALAAQPGVVAIGEIGLDYYRQRAQPANQDRALRAFLAIAHRRNLPVLIHCRNAYDALLAVLKECASSS
ncbi:MAG: TatD family hydrolase, partial [Candidatus Omnitrophica bacterium]|nr:TatD family hydrolase [Candidatus Omnitrophota bacterium]